MTTIGEALIEVRADTSRVDSDITRGVGRSTSGLTRSGSTLGRKFGLALGGAAGAAAFGGGAIIKSAVQLEAQYGKTMNVLQAQTRASGAEMNKLDALAKKMGADTVFSANDASQAMLELARGGMTPATIQAGALQGTLTLAAAGEMDMATAANTAVKAMGQFNLAGKDMDAVASALAGGANASSASVSDMAQALAQGGLAANSVGFSIQETTGILAAFSNAGLEGSDAGTSLKTALDRLQPSTGPAKAAMKELGLYTNEAGSAFVKANGEFKSAADIAGLLEGATRDLDAAERKRLITQAFGSDAQRAATILAEEGARGIEKMVKATSDQNAASRMAKANMKGTAGAIESLKGSAETAMLTLGQGLAPSIRDLARWTADEAMPQLQRFADWMQAEGAGKLRTFANGVTDVAEAGGDVLKFLADLPNPAKLAGLAAAVGGVGAMKLRGGGSGALGAVGSALGMARPVPVFVTNGAALGLGGGAAGKAGRLSTAASAVKKSILPAAALAAAGGVTHHYASQATPRNAITGRARTGGAEDYGYAATQMQAATSKMESSFGSMVKSAISASGQVAGAFAKLPEDVQTDMVLNGVPESKAQAAALVKQYNLTPKEKRTLFATMGQDAARNQTQALIKQYNLTPSSKSTNFSLNGIESARSQLISFSQELAQIRSKTVTVNTVFTESGRRFKEFAAGTSSAPGGMAWVGERGPELMTVPRGSRIVDSSRSRVMSRQASEAGRRSSGGAATFHIYDADRRLLGTMRGVAADEVGEAAAFDSTIGRMG